MLQLTSVALTESALQGSADRHGLTLGCRDLSDLFLCPSLAKSLLSAMAHCPGFSKPCDHFLDSRAWLFRALPPQPSGILSPRMQRWGEGVGRGANPQPSLLSSLLITASDLASAV